MEEGQIRSKKNNRVKLNYDFCTLKHGASEINYCRYSGGKDLLFAFHGFGKNSFNFDPIIPSLKKRYTIISFDLPFHGKTKWSSRKAFTKKELIKIINGFLAEEKAESFSLMGYSLGGKISLSLIEEFPSQINTVYLIAPDGLEKNFWFTLATGSYLGKRIFKSCVENPKPLFRLALLLKKLSIITNGLYKFVHYQMDTHKKRKKLYNIWLNIRNFEVDLLRTGEIIKSQKTPVYLFMGKYDSVIPFILGEKFIKKVPSAKLITLPKGHRVIGNYLNKIMGKIIKEK